MLVAEGAESGRSRISGAVMVGVAAIAFSGKAIIVKLAYRHGVDAVTLIMLRMLFALPLFAALAWWAGRGRPALTRRDWGSIALLGFCGYYLASFLDFAGLQYVSASPWPARVVTSPRRRRRAGGRWQRRSPPAPGRPGAR